MWTYIQKTGEILHDDALAAYGYSGHGEGKNNPAMQNVKKTGPIPAGTYKLSRLFRVTASHGPFVIELTPDPANQMFGRSGFLVHGDSISDPGTASLGCIIASRGTREKMWSSGDKVLKVVADIEEWR